MFKAIMMCLGVCWTAAEAITYALIILGLLGVGSFTAVRLFVI
jgi:hypothetical protein